MMSTLEEIEDAVRRLSSEELAAFRAWFAQLDAAAWDRQIEEDALIEGAAGFLTPHSFEELAQLQGVKPLENINVLAGGIPDDEDLDEFLDDIYKRREIA